MPLYVYVVTYHDIFHCFSLTCNEDISNCTSRLDGGETCEALPMIEMRGLYPQRPKAL